MKVPQICEKTGISGDYFNLYFSAFGEFSRGGKERLERVAEHFRTFPVEKYEERYSPEEYEDVVNEKNKARISWLNRMARIANEGMTDPRNFSERDFKRLMNIVHHLIYGQGLGYLFKHEEEENER